jgi:hypothetical protein
MNDLQQEAYYKNMQQEAVKHYYENTPIATWEKVFDSDLNYHFGDAISRNSEVFKSAKTFLDVGCGWGGPARRLIKEYNGVVEGVTNSKPQQEYIQKRDGYKVYLADANQYIANKEYDMAIFFQSFTHMKDESLINASKNVNKIFINDFVNATSPTQYVIPWNMIMRCVEDYKKLFDKIGFKLNIFNIQPRDIYIPNSKFWLKNIEKLSADELTPEITVLRDLCQRNLFDSLPLAQVVDIYAERK